MHVKILDRDPDLGWKRAFARAKAVTISHIPYSHLDRCSPFLVIHAELSSPSVYRWPHRILRRYQASERR